MQSLQQTIERQTEQIAEISAQLQATMKQAQDLAMKAFAGASHFCNQYKYSDNCLAKLMA